MLTTPSHQEVRISCPYLDIVRTTIVARRVGWRFCLTVVVITLESILISWSSPWGQDGILSVSWVCSHHQNLVLADLIAAPFLKNDFISFLLCFPALPPFLPTPLSLGDPILSASCQLYLQALHVASLLVTK